LLFPFARQIAAETTRSGGFPPMYLDPIDFGALYRNHLSQQQGATQVADSATTPQAADARASES
jgi:preprotein translocase subunit SecB